jgi:hypothetical protein
MVASMRRRSVKHRCGDGVGFLKLMTISRLGYLGTTALELPVSHRATGVHNISSPTSNMRRQHGVIGAFISTSSANNELDQTACITTLVKIFMVHTYSYVFPDLETSVSRPTASISTVRPSSMVESSYTTSEEQLPVTCSHTRLQTILETCVNEVNSLMMRYIPP